MASTRSRKRKRVVELSPIAGWENHIHDNYSEASVPSMLPDELLDDDGPKVKSRKSHKTGMSVRA